MELSKKIFVQNANMKLLLRKVTDLVRLFLSPVALFAHVFHPGPTCKKMNDLSEVKVFKSSAFEPEEDEIDEANRARKRARHHPPRTSVRKSAVSGAGLSDSDSEIEVSAPLRFRGATPELESSDDDMPDFSQLFANGRKLKIKGKNRSAGKKTLGSESDDVRIAFCFWVLILIEYHIPQEPDSVDNVSDLSDSDVNLAAQSTKNTKHKRDGKRNASISDIDGKPAPRGIEQAKGKAKTKIEEPDNPSGALIALWRRGDHDLEPSAKMLALIDFLQSWDAGGDKTICYSQCPHLR